MKHIKLFENFVDVGAFTEDIDAIMQDLIDDGELDIKKIQNSTIVAYEILHFEVDMKLCETLLKIEKKVKQLDNFVEFEIIYLDPLKQGKQEATASDFMSWFVNFPHKPIDMPIMTLKFFVHF